MAEGKPIKQDVTPVYLKAQGNMPIRCLQDAGVNFSEGLEYMFARKENGVRITRGQIIKVDKHVADKLLEVKIKSIHPMKLNEDIPAFVATSV